MNIAIMASGTGSNAQAIIASARAGILEASVTLVLSNKAGAPVLEKAAAAGIPSLAIPYDKQTSRSAYDRKLLAAIKQSGADCIALAGYMLLLSPEFLDGFHKPILNIHPSLLPAFPGARGIAGAFDYGVKLTGVSVHFVSEEMDMGPLIIQAAIPLEQDASIHTLEEKIHAIEHRLYPQALQWLCTGRLSCHGRKTVLMPASIKQAPPPPGCLIWPPLEEGF